jgi:CheY-like chemotaxis protein
MQSNPLPASSWSPSPRVQPQSQPQRAPARQTLLVAAAEADLPLYGLPAFQRVTARNNAELIALLARERPTAVVIDGDLPGLDAAAACTAARSHDGVSVLVAVGSPEQVPPFLKAGCHAILLKPFAPNLFAGRMGRLLRDRAQQPRGVDGTRTAHVPQGTNRAWETVACPRCSEPNAVSFDFTSHRRMWFACLACNQVWIGHRQE